MADETKENNGTVATATEQPAPEIDYKAELARTQAELERFKNAVTKANAEVSKVKKELADRMTAEEQAELARKEAEEAKERELAEYRARDRVNTYKDKFLAAGYDNEAAGIMAKALPEGVQDAYFEAIKQHNESVRQKANADALKQQPKPSAGGIPEAKDANLDTMRRAAGLT